MESTPQTTDSPALVGRKDSPKVKALLAAFDRRKPMESQLAVLQIIMAASPADLAEMAEGMSGPMRRSDAGWLQIRTAVRQRWVEIAPDRVIAWARDAQKDGQKGSVVIF